MAEIERLRAEIHHHQDSSAAGFDSSIAEIQAKLDDELNEIKKIRLSADRTEQVARAEFVKAEAGARAEAIRSLARAIHEGTLELDASDGLEASVAKIRALPGLGEWTAQYIAMRALREPDAIPVGDLGVRRALAAGGDLPSIKEVRERIRPWSPWGAYATIALWTSDHP